MNNICVDFKDRQVRVESGVTIEMDSPLYSALIESILNVACYGGETVCLEIREPDGRYREVGRWSFRR